MIKSIWACAVDPCCSSKLHAVFRLRFRCCPSLFPATALSPVYLQQQRHMKRIAPPPGKPPILPPAKTKRYQVVHPEWEDPEDVKELLWKRHIYLDAVASIRALIKQEIEAKSHGAGSMEQMIVNEKTEFTNILDENTAENERIARLRQADELNELKIMEDEATQLVQEHFNRTKEIAQSSAEQVRKVMEVSDSFITEENLESRIEDCLDNPEYADYAIDVEGNKYASDVPVTKYLDKAPLPQYMYEHTAKQIKVGSFASDSESKEENSEDEGEKKASATS